MNIIIIFSIIFENIYPELKLFFISKFIIHILIYGISKNRDVIVTMIDIYAFCVNKNSPMNTINGNSNVNNEINLFKK